MYVIKEMKTVLKKGLIDEEFFQPRPAVYLASMAKNFSFVDNLFLKFFAVITKRDIIVIPLHPESALVNREFTWIFGNLTYTHTGLYPFLLPYYHTYNGTNQFLAKF